MLADERLVTVGEGEVEVAHEALLREWPRLRGWLEEDAQGRRLHAHLTRCRRATGRTRGAIRASSTAARGSPRRSSGRPRTTASSTRSSASSSPRAARRASARSAGCERVVAGLGVLLALAVVAGAVALDQRGEARAQATAADAQRLGARALVEDDLDLSLLLARQGVELDDTPQTRGNLLAALLADARPRSACCAATAIASSTSTSARTSARWPSSTPTAR